MNLSWPPEGASFSICTIPTPMGAEDCATGVCDVDLQRFHAIRMSGAALA
jgi:hypothetical protein